MNIDIFMSVKNNSIWLYHYSLGKYGNQIACVNKSNYKQKRVIDGFSVGRICKGVEKRIMGCKNYYVAHLRTQNGYEFVAFECPEDAIVAEILDIVNNQGHFNPEVDSVKLYLDCSFVVKRYDFQQTLTDVFKSGKYNDIVNYEYCGKCELYCEPYKEDYVYVEETREVTEPSNEPEMTMQQVFEKVVGYDRDEFEKQINQQFGEMTGIW